jgi:malate:Na+ symporter
MDVNKQAGPPPLGRDAPPTAIADRGPWRTRLESLWRSTPPGSSAKVQGRLIPVPLLLLLAAAVVVLAARGAITPNLPMMIGVLIVGGFLCAEIGSILPLFKRAGGPALTAAFLPSYVVSRHWLPQTLVDSITTFTASTQFIYLFITAIVVGSILSMRRQQLISGMLKIFVPLVGASILALGVGALTGTALGMKTSDTLFMVVIPVMAGGVGEGVLPLSTGYAQLRQMNAGVFIAQLLPVVLFGNLVSIVFAGILNSLGRRFPHLTGNGTLEATSSQESRAFSPADADGSHAPLDLRAVIIASLVCILLYMLGVLCQSFTSFPSPVATLILAVILKLSGVLPPTLDTAAGAVGRFFAQAVTYPLLFAVAVAMTPWTAIVAALHPANLLLVVMVVSSLVVGGFFLGRIMRLYPIETALINACHSGSGGTGAVAILTASNRMELMPFAQIATRVGGAVTVALAFLAARWFGVW